MLVIGMKLNKRSHWSMGRAVKEKIFSIPLRGVPGAKNLQNIVAEWSRELPISFIQNLVKRGSLLRYCTVFNKIPDITKNEGMGGVRKNLKFEFFIF